MRMRLCTAKVSERRSPMRRSAIDATVPAGKHNAGFSDADHALDVAAEYLQMTSVALDRRTEPREMPADAHLRRPRATLSTR